MKRLFIPFAFILFLTASCSSGGKEPDDADAVSTSRADQVILKPFSDSLKTDTFKAVLKGEEVKDMVISFTITSHDGTLIYSRDFKATDLVSNYQSTLELDKETNQETFIRKEFNLFFEDENFLEPAVTENEGTDEYTPDPEFHEELKKSGLNGFKYRTSNETKVYIGWSEKDKKVKVYYQCC